MRAILLLLAALAAPHTSTPVPTPIGVGPGFRPPAAGADVLGGLRLGGLRCSAVDPTLRAHIELFVHGRALLLPAGIGVAAPLRRSGASVRPRGCRYPLSTVDPTGVIHATPGRVYTLGDVFRIWHQPLGMHRLLSFHSARAVRVYVNGARRCSPLRTTPLRGGDEIVVELGRYVPPHAFYLFPGSS
jgi:hypothetical protein